MKTKKASKQSGKKPHGKLKVFDLAPGVKFNEILMTGKQVIEEVYLTRRRLQYYRDTDKLSRVWQFGQYFYFRKEIAEMLEEGIIFRRKSS